MSPVIGLFTLATYDFAFFCSVRLFPKIIYKPADCPATITCTIAKKIKLFPEVDREVSTVECQVLLTSCAHWKDQVHF